MTTACMPLPVRALAVVPSAPQVDYGLLATGELVADAYSVTGLLALGGMGALYEARDVALNRRVAIKVPLSAAFAPALRGEALALASIRSDAFVKVFHVGRHRGVDFMVMERVFGATLAERIDDANANGLRIGIGETLAVLLALASALAKAHEAGVAQRDLKPTNIIIASDRIVIIDFGLAIPEVLVGPHNVVSGSPDYIAPEVLRHNVARGEGSLVDLYALGAVAFEMLTGSPPFADARLSQTLKQHLRTTARDVCALRDDVPRALGDLVCELLAKDPKARPVSADAVVWQLLSIIAARAASSRRP